MTLFGSGIFIFAPYDEKEVVNDRFCLFLDDKREKHGLHTFKDFIWLGDL